MISIKTFYATDTYKVNENRDRGSHVPGASLEMNANGEAASCAWEADCFGCCARSPRCARVTTRDEREPRDDRPGDAQCADTPDMLAVSRDRSAFCPFRGRVMPSLWLPARGRAPQPSVPLSRRDFSTSRYFSVIHGAHGDLAETSSGPHGRQNPAPTEAPVCRVPEPANA